MNSMSQFFSRKERITTRNHLQKFRISDWKNLSLIQWDPYNNSTWYEKFTNVDILASCFPSQVPFLVTALLLLLLLTLSLSLSIVFFPCLSYSRVFLSRFTRFHHLIIFLSLSLSLKLSIIPYLLSFSHLSESFRNIFWALSASWEVFDQKVCYFISNNDIFYPMIIFSTYRSNTFPYTGTVECRL